MTCASDLPEQENEAPELDDDRDRREPEEAEREQEQPAEEEGAALDLRLAHEERKRVHRTDREAQSYNEAQLAGRARARARMGRVVRACLRSP